MKKGVFLTIALLGFTLIGGNLHAQETTEDFPYQNPSEVLFDFDNGAITRDEALELLQRFFQQERFQQFLNQIAQYLDQLATGIGRENINMVGELLDKLAKGEIELEEATQQLKNLFQQPVGEDPTKRKGTPLDEAKKKAEQEKKKKAPEPEPEPEKADPVIHGQLTGFREINGKKYLVIKAKGVDICDGNGMQEADGETWLVEVDDETAKDLEDKIGEDIYIAGDIQPDVNGHLTIKMNPNYGGGIVTEDYQQEDWYKANVDDMIKNYWALIEQKYGDNLSYREKIELLKRMLYPEPGYNFNRPMPLRSQLLKNE